MNSQRPVSSPPAQTPHAVPSNTNDRHLSANPFNRPSLGPFSGNNVQGRDMRLRNENGYRSPNNSQPELRNYGDTSKCYIM